mmetsp:Transcript_7635/g.18861  ORF Transcript_7635/g.18861 Transcript_7635/m.18861 type:complete len:111 (-) Transcript_7635:44-376(-)
MYSFRLLAVVPYSGSVLKHSWLIDDSADSDTSFRHSCCSSNALMWLEICRTQRGIGIVHGCKVVTFFLRACPYDTAAAGRVRHPTDTVLAGQQVHNLTPRRRHRVLLTGG